MPDCRNGHANQRFQGGKWVCTQCGTEIPKEDKPFELCRSLRGPKNYDLELSDPVVLQSHLEQRAWCEQNILSGDRARETHTIKEDGPDFLKPFGNDPVKRQEAIAMKGYSPDGEY